MLSNIAVVGSLFAAKTVHAFTPHRDHYSNYAGGASYDTDIVEASVEIVLPKCSVGLPKYDYVTYTNNGWVGISAFTEDSGLLQTGISCYASEIDGKTTLSYSAWSEWVPNDPTYYEDSDYQAGDVLTARVVAYNESAGMSYIRNHRTGKEHRTLYTDQKVPLSMTDAEWVVESQLLVTEAGLSGQRNAGFTPWSFSNASYKKKDGSTHLMGGSEIYNCVLNGTQIFTATYEGPGCLQVNDTTPADYNPGS